MFRKMLRYLLVVGCFLIVGLLVHQLKRDYRRHRETISSYALIPLDQVTERKKFVVLIPSFRNEKYVGKNLRSVFEQDYDNYRVIYIDDCSGDQTLEEARELTAQLGMEERVTFVKNPHNLGQIANYYYAIESCDNDEIIVTLDGDDWFAHTGVLSELNRCYNDPNVWITYGQMITYPDYKKWHAKEPLFNRLKTGNVRAHWHCFRYSEWIFSQPRTFYAGLFKRLKLVDMFYNGGITKVTGDVAMMYPLLEMARGHSVFLPKIAYVYNQENPLSDGVLRKKAQRDAQDFFFSKKPYPPLLEDPREAMEFTSKKVAPIVVFSSDGPIRLDAFLQSVETWIHPKGEVIVLFESTGPLFDEGYALVKDAYPNCRYIEVSHKENMGDLLTSCLEDSKSRYAILAHDRILIKDAVDIREAEYLLERTGASGFYFQLGSHIEPVPKELTPIAGGAFVWKFTHAHESWEEANNVQMTLYPKKEILRIARTMAPESIGNFILGWMRGFDTKGIGVCFSESKAIDAAVRIVKRENRSEEELYSNEELNNRFLEGYVIDIQNFSQKRNNKVAVEYYPKFLFKNRYPSLTN